MYFASGKARGVECLTSGEGLVLVLQRPDHVIVSDQQIRIAAGGLSPLADGLKL